MIQAQTWICPGESDAQTSLGFWYTNGYLISARRSDLLIVNKKTKKKKQKKQKKTKRTCQIGDFVVSAEHRVKIKESEKRDKYIDLARELKKKLWNMKVTVKLIVAGVLKAIPEWLVKDMESL